jgi:hypothetical protein
MPIGGDDSEDDDGTGSCPTMRGLKPSSERPGPTTVARTTGGEVHRIT